MRDSTLQASSTVRSVAVALNWWGGPGVIWFAAALWLGGRALRRAGLARIGLRGAEGLAIASAVSGIAKGLAGRARPFVAPGEPWHWEFNRGWSEAQYFSFPSGHTTATAAFVVGVALATRGLRPSTRGAILVPLVASVAGVAFARVYSDQHWFSDVIAAVLVGTMTSLALAALHKRTRNATYDRVMLGSVAASSADPA